MVKNYCDCCGREIGRIFKFEYCVHIENMQEWGGHISLIDGESHPISGRTESKDLCLICYNKIFDVAFKKFIFEQKTDKNLET